jgi:hypothetical protein
MGENFPREEKYVDCSGMERLFEITLKPIIVDGYLVHAREITNDKYGYEFSIYSSASPFEALGRLRHKIRRGLSRKYLSKHQEQITFSHDEAVGEIDGDGIIIDGRLVNWHELESILISFSGFQIKLQISEGDD